MTPCAFVGPEEIGHTPEGFSIIRVACIEHGSYAACPVWWNLDGAVSEMRERLEAHCFEKFMKEQMGVVK